jgi:hypothetical protein
LCPFVSTVRSALTTRDKFAIVLPQQTRD